jgi:hypothetical protein
MGPVRRPGQTLDAVQGTSSWSGGNVSAIWALSASGQVDGGYMGQLVGHDRLSAWLRGRANPDVKAASPDNPGSARQLLPPIACSPPRIPAQEPASDRTRDNRTCGPAGSQIGSDEFIGPGQDGVSTAICP